MLTMKSLSDHLTPATQRDVTVWQRAMVHLEVKKSPTIHNNFNFFVIMQIVLLNSGTYTMAFKEAEMLTDRNIL